MMNLIMERTGSEDKSDDRQTSYEPSKKCDTDCESTYANNNNLKSQRQSPQNKCGADSKQSSGTNMGYLSTQHQQQALNGFPLGMDLQQSQHLLHSLKAGTLCDEQGGNNNSSSAATQAAVQAFAQMLGAVSSPLNPTMQSLLANQALQAAATQPTQPPPAPDMNQFLTQLMTAAATAGYQQQQQQLLLQQLNVCSLLVRVHFVQQ